MPGMDTGTGTGTGTDTYISAPVMTERAGEPPKLLCFGFGYTARALVEDLAKDLPEDPQDAGWEVVGTCRDVA